MRRVSPWLLHRKFALAAEGFHFGENSGCFGFEGGALRGKVFLGVFAGAVLEVEVAEVVVDDFFALAKVVEARLFDFGGEAGLRPEDVGETGDREEDGRDDGLGVHYFWLQLS